MEKSDAAIIKSVLAGNVEAFGLLVNRYDDAIRRYVRRLGVAPPDDGDVLQSAFLKAYKNLHGYNPRYAFSPWIYRIARNEAVSHYRRTKRKHLFCDDREETWFWEGVVTERDPVTAVIETEDAAAEAETRQWLAGALRTIGAKYAEPLTLHFFEGKRYEEIADILRLPVSTVGTRIRRAKEKLRSLYTERGKKV